MLQKLKLTAVSLLLIAAVGVPLLSAPSALAASAGTCFYHGPGGNKTESCKNLGITTGMKDNSGKAVSYSNCYEVDATTSSSTIIHVDCTTQKAVDGSGSNGCVVGNEAACSVNQSNCSTTGVVVEHCADQAVSGGGCTTTTNCDIITKYVSPLVELLAAGVGVAVVISIVIGGIQYGSSGGDPQKVTAAKNRIRNAIVALIAFIFLFALLNFLIPGGLL